MNRRKLIRKLATPAVIIAIVSLVVILLQFPYRNYTFKNHQEEFKKYFSSFLEENKSYLKGIVGKIKSVPVNQVLVNELQAEYAIEHQKADAPKRYLWMSDRNGNILFGAPANVIDKMNNNYDKYQTTIKADEYYRDRNDFLLKLIDKSEEIDFSQFAQNDIRSDRFYDKYWRFYKEDLNDWNSPYLQSTSTVFTSSVYSSNGEILGNLFMKVDDSVNKEKYYNEHALKQDDIFFLLINIFGTLLGFACAFLWFLLPTWVYLDAQERDVKTPGIWAFLSLISLFFGLTIYLITRPNTFKSFTCPKCDGELNGTRAYCPHCGNDLSNTFCQQCQYPIKSEWQFCPNCRAQTNTKTVKEVIAHQHNNTGPDSH